MANLILFLSNVTSFLLLIINNYEAARASLSFFHKIIFRFTNFDSSNCCVARRMVNLKLLFDNNKLFSVKQIIPELKNGTIHYPGLPLKH